MSYYRWKVSGVQRRYSPGAMLRTYEDDGVIEAEGMGEALNELVHRGAYWDVLDTDHPLTLEIEPVSDL